MGKPSKFYNVVWCGGGEGGGSPYVCVIEGVRTFDRMEVGVQGSKRAHTYGTDSITLTADAGGNKNPQDC